MSLRMLAVCSASCSDVAVPLMLLAQMRVKYGPHGFGPAGLRIGLLRDPAI